MKDEVEKQIDVIMDLLQPVNAKPGKLTPMISKYEGKKRIIALFQKAQVEAVRAARIDERQLITKKPYKVITDSLGKEFMYYSLASHKDRLVELTKEDGETKQ